MSGAPSEAPDPHPERTITELTDLGPLGSCAGCERDFNAAEWFWYADGGSIHLTFCQDCDPGPESWHRYERAMPIRLTDDRSGETFVRLVSLPDEWFDDGDSA